MVCSREEVLAHAKDISIPNAHSSFVKCLAELLFEFCDVLLIDLHQPIIGVPLEIITSIWPRFEPFLMTDRLADQVFQLSSFHLWVWRVPLKLVVLRKGLVQLDTVTR